MSVSVGVKDEAALDLFEMYDDYDEDDLEDDKGGQNSNFNDSGAMESDHTAEDERDYSQFNFTYEDNEGPSSGSSTNNDEADYSEDFGIKIVSTESLMENNETDIGYNDEEDECSLGDDENYRFLIPDVEIEEISTTETAEDYKSPQNYKQPNVVHTRRERLQQQVPSATNIFERLFAVDPIKPNILNRKLSFKPIAKMPPPPPLTRRPSVPAGRGLTVAAATPSPAKPPPIQMSLEQILRSSKPMPRLYPKVGPTGKVAIERLPNPRSFHKSFQSKTILPSNSNNNNEAEHPLLGERISKKTVPRCTACNKTFATYTILSRHQKVHESMVTCYVCNMNFADQQVLDEHIRTNPKCNASGLQCRVCYRGFATNTALLAHMPIHEGMYRCRGCRKGFYDYASMEEHEATHTRYACEWCGKTFMNSGNLKAHERIHTGERPFKCADCPKAFKQLGGLQYHLKTNPSHRNAQHC